MQQLDKSQRAFVEAPVGNIRLLAPAGCGKTLCLLHRCKFLAESAEGSPPRFLIVTFTRAARDELWSRLVEDREFASIRDRRVTRIATLNQWGLRRIKEVKDYAKHIDKKQYCSIMENDLQRVWQDRKCIRDAIKNGVRLRASRELMKMIDTYQSLGFDHVRMKSVDDFMSHCNELQNHGLGRHLEKQVSILIRLGVLSENVTKLDSDLQQNEVYRNWYKFWGAATQSLYDSAKFTFEGQKYFAYQDELEKLKNEVFYQGATRRHHVLVDEFQDINPLDLALIRTIVERNRATLTLAGDDDQAIFEWRGATPTYILDPPKYFESDFETIQLEVNYRSPANIVEHSQQLIKNNQFREPKHISAYSSSMANITVRPTENLTESIGYVRRLINSTIAHSEKPSQIAIIGRLKCQIIPFQISFASNYIPFCAAEDLNVFLSETFKQLLKLLEMKGRGSEDRSSSKVANDILAMCRYVMWTPLSKKDNASLRKWILEARPRTTFEGISRLEEYRGELRRNGNKDGRINSNMAESLLSFLDSQTVSDSLLSLSQNFAGLRKDFHKAEDDFFFKDPPLLYLADYARRYGENHQDFVDDLELAKETLAHVPPPDDDYGEDLSKYPVHLMTATRAKGKEFDKVVILDAQDEIWPHKHVESIQELEAERRLFYVAFTRAREQVTMLLRRGAVPSPYIQELGLAD